MAIPITGDEYSAAVWFADLLRTLIKDGTEGPVALPGIVLPPGAYPEAPEHIANRQMQKLGLALIQGLRSSAAPLPVSSAAAPGSGPQFAAWDHQHGPPQQADFVNLPANTGDGWAQSSNPIRIRTLADGNVQVQGYVTKSTPLSTTGTNNDVVLADGVPAGQRADVSFICASGGACGAWCRVSISTAGRIEVWDWAAGGTPASVGFLYLNFIYAPTA